MKRSEMIEIMSLALRRWLVLRRKNGATRGKSLETYLLSEIESEGMLPPFNVHAFFMDGDHADSKSSIYRTWESEDEAQ